MLVLSLLIIAGDVAITLPSISFRLAKWISQVLATTSVEPVIDKLDVK